VACVAKPDVAESRVAVVVEDEGGPSAVSFPVSEGKRRRVDNSSKEVESVMDERGVVTVVPLGLRGGALLGPRAYMADRVGGIRRGNGVLADLFIRRAYRFVDRSLIGTCNGMVGDSYQTKGGGACGQVRGNFGGHFAGRRHVHIIEG